mmetsp:Transcript_10448/g.27805  ORF Transcript_10448/g.27805 Transcript_10448/m.27805 type:complete len:200 (+) Transcript_10448:515-1114(+)
MVLKSSFNRQRTDLDKQMLANSRRESFVKSTAALFHAAARTIVFPQPAALCSRLRARFVSFSMLAFCNANTPRHASTTSKPSALPASDKQLSSPFAALISFRTFFNAEETAVPPVASSLKRPSFGSVLAATRAANKDSQNFNSGFDALDGIAITLSTLRTARLTAVGTRTSSSAQSVSPFAVTRRSSCSRMAWTSLSPK